MVNWKTPFFNNVHVGSIDRAAAPLENAKAVVALTLRA